MLRLRLVRQRPRENRGDDTDNCCAQLARIEVAGGSPRNKGGANPEDARHEGFGVTLESDREKAD